MGPLISALTTILTATNLMEDIIRNQGSINEPGEFAIFDFIVGKVISQKMGNLVEKTFIELHLLKF